MPHSMCYVEKPQEQLQEQIDLKHWVNTQKKVKGESVDA